MFANAKNFGFFGRRTRRDGQFEKSSLCKKTFRRGPTRVACAQRPVLHVMFPMLVSKSLLCNSHLTKPRRRRRRRQRKPQKPIGLMSKTTTLHVHHAFLYISLPSLHDYDVKWPKFKFTFERERQGDKFYHLCPNWARSPLFSSSQNPLFLSNRANWDNHEKV